MRYFYVESRNITENKALITEPEAGHIRKVLRLKPGDMVGLYDGSGMEFHSRLQKFTDLGIEATIENRVESPSESPVHITLAQGFLKESKMDELVRQLTELGVNRWIPFIGERSVSRPSEKSLANRLERWQTISRQAIKQCRRGKFMNIDHPLPFSEMISASNNSELKIVFWEEETIPLKQIMALVDKNPVKSVFLIIGPEGGLTRKEVNHAMSSGFKIAGLGPRILRAETATVSACSLVQHLFGDLG